MLFGASSGDVATKTFFTAVAVVVKCSICCLPNRLYFPLLKINVILFQEPDMLKRKELAKENHTSQLKKKK